MYVDQSFAPQQVAASKLSLASPFLRAELCAKLGIKELSSVLVQRLVGTPSIDAAAAAADADGVPPHVVQTLKVLVAAIPQQSEFDLHRQLDAVGNLAKYSVCTSTSLRVQCTLRQSRQTVGPEVTKSFFVDRSTRTLWVASSTTAARSDHPGSATALHGGEVLREDALSAAINALVSPRAPLAIAPLLRCTAIGAEAATTALAFPSVGRHSMRGVAGEVVIQTDVPLLRMQPSRLYHDGEVVAFQPKRTLNDSDSRGDGSGALAFLYGRIVIPEGTDGDGDVLTKGGRQFSGLNAQLVSVGVRGVRKLLPSEVWCFTSTSMHAEQSAVCGDAGESAAAAAASQGNGRSSSMVGESSRDVRTERDDACGVGVGQSTALTLTTADYITAARDLLAHANLPLSDADGKVYERNLELEREVKTLHGSVAALRKKNNDSEVKIEALEDSSTCTICFQGPADGVDINIALVPCGHVFCGSCASRLSSCASCKSTIQTRLTLFK